MEWLHFQTLHSRNWCPSRLCTGTTSVLPIYEIIGLCNCITQTFPTLLSYPSLSPPLTAPCLQHTSQNVWQTSAPGWLPRHPLKLNLSKTEVLLMPGKDCPHMDFIVWCTSCHIFQFKIYFSGWTAEICGRGRERHLHSISTFSFST